VTIVTDPLFYALAVPAVLALEAAAILLPIMMAQDAVALWVYRKERNWRALATIGLNVITAMALSCWIMASSSV
jgi:uncharacterized protein